MKKIIGFTIVGCLLIVGSSYLKASGYSSKDCINTAACAGFWPSGNSDKNGSYTRVGAHCGKATDKSQSPCGGVRTQEGAAE